MVFAIIMTHWITTSSVLSFYRVTDGNQKLKRKHFSRAEAAAVRMTASLSHDRQRAVTLWSHAEVGRLTAGEARRPQVGKCKGSQRERESRFTFSLRFNCQNHLHSRTETKLIPSWPELYDSTPPRCDHGKVLMFFYSDTLFLYCWGEKRKWCYVKLFTISSEVKSEITVCEGGKREYLYFSQFSLRSSRFLLRVITQIYTWSYI